MFHSFFQFSSKVEVPIFLFTFFQFYSVVSRDSKVDYFASSLFSFFFFLLIIIKSGLLARIRGSVCMLKSHRSLCVSFSRTGAWLCIYHLLIIIIIILLMRVFHASLSCGILTGVCELERLFKKKTGLFVAFWSILIMQSSEWSPLVFCFQVFRCLN